MQFLKKVFPPDSSDHKCKKVNEDSSNKIGNVNSFQIFPKLNPGDVFQKKIEKNDTNDDANPEFP